MSDLIRLVSASSISSDLLRSPPISSDLLRSPPISSDLLRSPLLSGELPKLLTLLLWALWLTPSLLEVFALPPFLADLELALLLNTARLYPNGVPPDDLLVGTDPAAGALGTIVPSRKLPLPTPRCTAAGPTAPPRAPMGALGLSYVVQKGLESEQTPPRAACKCSPRRPPPHRYVVQKGIESEQTWYQTLWSVCSWRGLRQCWRWITGSKPLENPARRLAEHHAWIIETGGDGMSGGWSTGADAGGSEHGAANGSSSRPSSDRNGAGAGNGSGGDGGRMSPTALLPRSLMYTVTTPTGTTTRHTPREVLL